MDDDLVKWYSAMWTFLGMNSRDRDFRRGHELAKESKHPDAIWLYSLFPPGKWLADPRRILEKEDASDPRVLFFLGILHNPWMSATGRDLIRRACEQNFGAALGWMSSWEVGAHKLAFAERAAEQFE